MEGCDIKELRTLGRLMADSEEREIRCRRLALAREKFEFKAAKAVWKQMPLLNQMLQEDEAREDERIDAIRLAIFGGTPMTNNQIQIKTQADFFTLPVAASRYFRAGLNPGLRWCVAQ